MKRCVIVDLDGCISDDRERRWLIGEGWAKYHAACGADEYVNRQIVEHHRSAGHHILFITGRPVTYRADTLDWMDRNIGELDGFSLLMRPEGDDTSTPTLKVRLFDACPDWFWEQVDCAYDDRRDVLDAYAEKGVCVVPITLPPEDLPGTVEAESPPENIHRTTVPDILRRAATTYEERNLIYGDNFRRVGPIMRALFPEGVSPELLGSDAFHLFELKVVKLTRFAISGLTHVDSIHDDAVYSAMIEAILLEGKADEH